MQIEPTVLTWFVTFRGIRSGLFWSDTVSVMVDTMETRRLLIFAGLEQADAAESAAEWASVCRAVAALLDRYDELSPPDPAATSEGALLAELEALSNSQS